MSDDTRNIYERIEAARPNFGAVVRRTPGQVGTRAYQYADLDDVCDAVEAALLAEGVGVFPFVKAADVYRENVACEVVTALRVLNNPRDEHVSSIPVPLDLSPQQVGSAITYFRRYGLTAALNLRTEPDDDGGAASSPVITREVAPEAQADAAPVETPVPDGWDSREQAIAAHQRLAERIAALPVGTIDTAAFRATHSFPYSTTDYNELEEVVRTAESLLA